MASTPHPPPRPQPPPPPKPTPPPAARESHIEGRIEGTVVEDQKRSSPPPERESAGNQRESTSAGQKKLDRKAKDAPKYPILPPEQAASLFKNGHRIAKDGDAPSKWISMGRLGDGTAVMQTPMTPEIEKEIAEGSYYLAEGVKEEEATAPSPPAGPPTVVDAPYVEQTADLITCTMGNWEGEPTGYAYQWRRDGANIGTGSAQYVVTGADVGKTVDCVVTATNALGSTPSTSNSVVVTAPAKK